MTLREEILKNSGIITEGERPIKTWQDLYKPSKLPNYCGVSGVKMISHGDSADPEIKYKGKIYSYYDLEDALVGIYREEHPEDKGDKNFDRWVKSNPDEVYSVLNELEPKK